MTRSSRHRRLTCQPRFDVLESRTLPSTSPVWSILGDRDPGNLDDTIVVRQSRRDAGTLEAVVDGQVVSTHSVADLTQLRIIAGAGDDTVTVNLADRNNDFAVSIQGGTGNNH